MKFRLDIELGNDAMKTGEDLAQVIQGVANTVRKYNADELAQAADETHSMRLRDVNGNTVGSWRVEP